MAEVSIGAALGKYPLSASGTSRIHEADTGLVVEKLEGSTVAVRNDGLEGTSAVFSSFDLV